MTVHCGTNLRIAWPRGLREKFRRLHDHSIETISTLKRLFIDQRLLYRMQLRSEEHTSELQSRQYLPSFPTRHSSDLVTHAGLLSGLAGSCRSGTHDCSLRNESAHRLAAGSSREVPTPSRSFH